MPFPCGHGSRSQLMLATGLSGLQMMCMGLAILVLTWTVRRRVRQSRMNKKDALQLAREELDKLETSAWGKVQGLEARLQDFARKNQAELETQTLKLEELIQRAENATREESLDSSQTGLIRCLAQAGYSAEEVSTIAECSLESVCDVLQVADRRAA